MSDAGRETAASSSSPPAPAPEGAASGAHESGASDSNKDNGYTPGTSLLTQFSNLYSYVTGRMTSTGVDAMLRDQDIRNEPADCARCEANRDFLLAYSPIIRFLQANLQQLGGGNSSSSSGFSAANVNCRRCDRKQQGGFDTTYGILLCANSVKSRSHVEDAMAHEMVHAYDHLRFKLDWSNLNLRHAACTEIRASSLSGECRWAREFFTRRQWRLVRQHQECVRRRAVLSVAGRPNCKDREQAERTVDEVWDSCFRDTRPFDEIYR